MTKLQSITLDESLASWCIVSTWKGTLTYIMTWFSQWGDRNQIACTKKNKGLKYSVMPVIFFYSLIEQQRMGWENSYFSAVL